VGGRAAGARDDAHGALAVLWRGSEGDRKGQKRERPALESGPRPTRKEVEPGGIEPPSRDSRQDASTRVSDGLISVPKTAIGSLLRNPASGNSSRTPRSEEHTSELQSRENL